MISRILKKFKKDITFIYQLINHSVISSIPFPGLDGNFVSPATFPVACGFGTWMLTLGFTLAYGAMFSKIWRVHRLKDKSESKKVS